MADPNNASVINVGNIMRAFAILIYMLAVITSFVALDKVDDAADNNALVETCDDKPNGTDCTDNFNALWAVAMVAATIIGVVLIGVLAELKIAFIFRHINFLARMIGRGIWMIILGLLCLGVAGNLGIASCILCMVFGAIQIVVGLMCEKTAPASNSSV